MTQLYFPKYAKQRCKNCTGLLEICAFVDKEYVEPMFSCYRCGEIATLNEYGLKPEDIAISKEEYEKTTKGEKGDDGQRQLLSG